MIGILPHRLLLLAALFLSGGLLLAGCVTNKIDADNAPQIFDSFSAGTLRLSVGLGHVGNNIWFGKRMQQAEIAEDWSSLAKLVIEADDGDDMGYFYLGRAAEGKGLVPAARRYYQLSTKATYTPGLMPACPHARRMTTVITAVATSYHTMHMHGFQRYGRSAKSRGRICGPCDI